MTQSEKPTRFYARRNFLLSIFLLLSCLPGIAQQVSCTDEIKITRDIKNMEVIGSDESGFFVVDENRKEENIRISRFAYKTMKMEWVQTLPMPKGTNDQQFEKIIFLKDKFLLFTSLFNKENEQLQVYCTFLDQKGQKMYDPALVHYILSEGRSNAPVFGFGISPDSTKLLLYFDPPFERKSSEAIAFKCYNTDLEMLWEKEILLPYTQDIVQVHSFMLDDLTNIYMMSGRNPEKSGRQWQKPQGGRYVVFFYNAKDNKLKEYDLSLKDKQVMSVIFQLNKNQEAVIAGFYSNDYKFSAAGTFLFSIGAYGTAVKTASFMPFPKEFLSKLLRKKDVENEAALPDFYLDHMIFIENDEMILIGEQYYASEYTITDPTTGRQTIEYRYNFDDIIVTKLEASGRHGWNVKIPKRQFTTSDTKMCSYQCFETSTGLVFYFNDHPENQQKLSSLAEGDATLWSGGKNSVTTRIVLDNAGSFKREILLSNREHDALLNTFFGQKNVYAPQILGYENGKINRYCLVR